MTSTRVMDGNLNDRTWINISESRGELGIGNRVSFPTNLYLKKRVNSPYFYASWMPEKEDDYRVTNKKRTPKYLCMQITIHSAASTSYCPRLRHRLYSKTLERYIIDVLSSILLEDTWFQSSIPRDSYLSFRYLTKHMKK